MYLKALEIQGFKSFPEKTVLSFEKDITAIVGPNGSGKSNISDAILWVMGEQSTKSLRGSKMEDVIFGGTESRNPLGFAQVSLVFDNSAGIFDSELDEVTLSRRYYRSGESEYYINKENVRLKDINSLLMDTGLGRDGYSIIGQGRIAEIVSSKSIDRRDVFDEAAGISRYRYRKEEAERKLERTQESLLRINDRIEELELQVGPLKSQAETARRYLLLRDDLRIKEVSLWMDSLERIRDNAKSINDEFQSLSSALEKARGELEMIYRSSDNLSERMHERDIYTEKLREELSEKEAEVSALEAQRAVTQANIESLRKNKEQMLRDIEEGISRTEEIKAGILSGQSRIDEIKESISILEEKIVESGNIADGLEMKLGSREADVQRLSSQHTEAEVESRSMEARINMLASMERDYEGYSKAVKAVMREAGRGNLKGIYGPAANLLKTDAEYAVAIETALGGASQHIVTDTQKSGAACIEYLKRTDNGRDTFLPADTLSGSLAGDLPDDDPGYVGLAYDLVSFDKKFDGIFRYLLGRVLVAETLSDAIRIAKKTGNKLRTVSLDGQQVNVSGSLTGGSVSKTGFLSRASELEKLKAESLEYKRKEEQLRASLNKAMSELEKARADIAGARASRASLESKKETLNAEKKATDLSNNQLKALLSALSGDSDSRKNLVSETEERITALRSELIENEKEKKKAEKQASDIRDEINKAVSERLELEGKQNKAGKLAQEKNDAIIDLERKKAKAEQKKAASESEEKQIIDRLWENYELSHSKALEIRQPIGSISSATREVNAIKREMASLGTPNLGAIDEYARVSERYDFLTSQRDDIEKAEKELRGIIGDITSEMKKVFRERFREIDEAFRTTFTEMFGGGKAELLLEDEEDVLNCGIDIRAQPPGKKLSTISLLSGGEMAFVAIALYFAILKVRPTPFCVMDEIEAALDEANVSRFASYLRKMSGKTQFLVITHRRGTMEEADMLYGVTMQEKGVSKVLKLDLAEAEKTIEEK